LGSELQIIPRKQLRNPVLPTVSNGGLLDDVVWDGLINVVVAANRREARSVLDNFLKVGNRVDLAGHRLIGVYLNGLLDHHLNDILGHAPTKDDLRALSKPLSSTFDQLLPASLGYLESTLVVSAELDPFDTALNYAEFTLHMAVALGLLLGDPAHDLSIGRDSLSSWLMERADFIRDFCASPPRIAD
jgi:hypothetical protein